MKNRGLKDGRFNFGKALGLKQKKKDLVGIISKMCRDSFAKRPGLTGIDLALIDSGSNGSGRAGRLGAVRAGNWLGSNSAGQVARLQAAMRLGVERLSGGAAQWLWNAGDLRRAAAG